MTREEAITVLKVFMENPLFSEVHKAAFNIAIHDIKAHQDWNINNLILVNKDNYEPIEQEPTAKNDLEVDCISRADALDCVNWGYSLSNVYEKINELPSVTPIRPKGHWTEEFNDLEGEVRFTCSSCGKFQLFGTDFCYHCGSDNREVEV